MTPLAGLDGKHIPAVVLQSRPEFRRRRQNIVESGRHYAYDRVVIVVELDLSANDCAIAAEVPAPQAVAENYTFWTVKHIVRGPEVSPQRWRYAQRAEVAGAYLLAIDSFRLIGPRECGLPWL